MNNAADNEENPDRITYGMLNLYLDNTEIGESDDDMMNLLLQRFIKT